MRQNLCVSSLEVVIALEDDEGQGEGENEHQEGGDDEAEDTGQLNTTLVGVKWPMVTRSQIDVGYTELWTPCLCIYGASEKLRKL